MSIIERLKNYKPTLADILVFASMLLIVIVRLRLIDYPLERDEGEYAMMGRLILDGEAPYGAAFNMKYPGIYYMYAFFMMIFGQSVIGIRLGFLLLNLGTIFLMWRLATKMLGNFPGGIAAATFGLMSLSPNVLGFSAHATQFIIAPMLAGVLLMLSDDQNAIRKWGLTGIMFGLAVLMKQHGIFFLIVGGVGALLIGEKGMPAMIRRVIFYGIGSAAPILLAFLFLMILGVFEDFWFWTFEYAATYAAGKSASNGLAIFNHSFSNVTGWYLPIWLLGVIGAVLILFNKKIEKPHRYIVLSILAAGTIAIIPSLNFFSHHFITALPGIALGFGAAIGFITKGFSNDLMKRTVFLLFFGMLFTIWMTDAKKYFVTHHEELSLEIYGANAPINFVSTRIIGKYIKENTAEDSPLLIIGAEPEICFYADRPPANPFIYVYGLMEVHELSEKMQKDWIRYSEEAEYEVVVVFPTFAWSPRWNSLQHIIKWTNTIADSFKPKAWLIRDEIGGTKWILGERAANYRPRDFNYVMIAERIK